MPHSSQRVQLTPKLHPRSSELLSAAARERSLTASTLLRLAVEEVWPSLGPWRPGLVLGDVLDGPGADGQWVQRCTLISRTSFERLEIERKRRGLRLRSPLLRAAIERRYPAG